MSTTSYVFKSVLKNKPKIQADSLAKSTTSYVFKSVLKNKENKNKDTTIDSIYRGLKELEYNGKDGLTERTNNPVATLWTQELADKFQAVKGPKLPAKDNPENRDLYTAVFPNKELGEKGGKFIIENIYNNAGGDLENFASIYPLGLKRSQLITDEQIAIKDRYFKTISKYMGKNDYNTIIKNRENDIANAVNEEASRIRNTGEAYNDTLDAIDIFTPTRTIKSNQPFYEKYPVDNNKKVIEPQDSMLLTEIQESVVPLNSIDEIEKTNELGNQVGFYQDNFSISQYREPSGIDAFKTVIQNTFGGESPNDKTIKQLAVNVLNNVGDVIFGIGDFKNQVVDFVMTGKGGRELAENILSGYASVPELAKDLVLASLKPVANKYPENQRKFIDEAYDRWFESPLNAPLVAVGLKAGGANAKGYAKLVSNKTRDLTEYSKSALKVAKGDKDKLNVNYTTKALSENIKNPQVLQQVIDIAENKPVGSKGLKTPATKRQIEDAKTTIADLADNITQQKSLLENPNVARTMTPNQKQQMLQSIENASKIIEEQLGVLGEKGATNTIKKTYGLTEPQSKVFINFVKELGKGAKESAFRLLDTPIASAIMGRQTGSIFDESQPVPKRFEATKKFLEETNQANKIESGMNLGTFAKIKGKLAKATVDVGSEVNLIIDKAIKGAGGEESALLKAVRIEKDFINGSNTKAGLKIEQVNSAIYNQLSRKETKMLDAIILLRNESGLKKFHTDELVRLKAKRKTESSKPELRKIDEEIKRIENYQYSGGKKTATYDGVVDDALASLPSDVRGKINDLADNYFAVFREAVDELLESGLIDETSANQFKRREYMPKKYLQYIRGEKDYVIKNKRITVHDNGIKKMKTGDEGFLFNNSKLLLYDFLTSSKNRIARNNADRALDSLLKTKKGGYEGIGYRLKDNTSKVKEGYTRIEFFEGGRKKYIALEDDFASGWVVSDPVIGPRVMNAVGWLTGSKIIKATATGYNPAFAITNIARDMAFITLNEHGAYSNFLPYAYGQMMRDMAKVSRDVWKKEGRYLDYINEGGGMSFLSRPLRGDAFSGKVANAYQFTERILGKIGEYSELTTRIAFRERLIKNGLSPKEATWRARSYMDFSKGGQISRTLEVFIPYANANIQATRGMLKGMKDKRWWVKAGQLTALKYGAYKWATSSKENQEVYDRISDTQKFSNLIIPVPALRSENPNTGESKPLAIKIPLDSGQQLVGGIMEMAFAYSEKKRLPDYHYDQVAKIVGSLAPIDVGRLSPTLNVMIALNSGKRFPYKTDIYLGGEKNIEESLKTNFNEENIYKDISAFFNVSPAKMKYTSERFIARGNMYYDIGLGGYDYVRKQMSEEDLNEYDRNASKYVGIPALNAVGLRVLRDRFIAFPEDKIYTTKEKAVELDKERNSIRVEMNNELIRASLAIVNNKDNPDKQQEIYSAVVNKLEEYKEEYGQKEYQDRSDFFRKKLAENSLTLTKGLVEIAGSLTPRYRAYFLADFVARYPQDDERYKAIIKDLEKISPRNPRTGKFTGFFNDETREEFNNLMKNYYEGGVIPEPFPFKK